MAHRAGAEISDMEFVQFHPTALYLKNAPRFLLSEALRGEGAYLRNIELKRFMPKYHEMAELAPRDVVARAIAHELELQQSARRRRLPRPDASQCRPRAQALPHDLRHLHAVQHRHRHRVDSDSACGALRHGRRTHRSRWADLDCPASTLPEKWPAPACTEPIAWPAIPCWKVWSTARAQPKQCRTRRARRTRVRQFRLTAQSSNGNTADVESLYSPGAVAHVAARRAWCAKELRCGKWSQNSPGYNSSAPKSGSRLAREAANILETGLLIARAALAREESRGAHYRLDFPLKNDAKFHKHSVICGDSIRFQ